MRQVALIGVTGYAAVHLEFLRSFARQGRLRLCAVTVINRPQAELVCRELEDEGCMIFTDHCQMLAAWSGRIDLCVIPTSSYLHAAMTVAALESGAHVLLEKPLAPTLPEIESILAAERRTGRWVAVGFQDFYAPELGQLRKRLAGGEWGAVHEVTGPCLWPRSFAYYQRNSWAGRLHIEGRAVFDSPLSNAMAHFVLTMLRLAAPADRPATHLLEPRADLRRAYPIESFDTFSLHARTAQGVGFRFAGSHACRLERGPEIVVHAEHARIVWRYENSLVIETAHGQESPPITDSHGARRHQLAAVLAKLEDPSVPICTTALAAIHARLYIGLHARYAIADAPATEVAQEVRDGHTWRSIRGIEDELAAFVDHAIA